MLIRSLCVLTLIFVGVQASAEIELGEDGRPKIDMLQRFKPFSGRWVGTVKNKATEVFPEPFEITIEQEGGFILDGTMFQFRGLGDMDGEKGESIFLYGFDRTEGSYCCWQYNDIGGFIKYKVEWAEDGQSYIKTSLNDEEIGVSVTTEVELDEGKAIRWTSRIVATDGRLLVDQTGELSREAGEVEFLKHDVEDDSAMAIYKPYTGEWRSTIQGKVTDVFKEPYEIVSAWEGRFLLGGKMFEFSGTAPAVVGPDYDYLWYTLYDEQEQKYLPFYHDSLGNHARHDAQWDAEKRAMRLVPDNTEQLGFKPVFTTYFVDDQTLRFSLRLIANDGTLVTDESGEAKPVKD